MQNLYKSFQPTLTESGLMHFGLSLKSSFACNALRGAVHSFLQIKATKPTPYPLVPDGTQAIFISPNGSTIGGTQSKAYDVQILEAGEYFGIWFHPGALRYFFNLNISEITDRFVDSDYFPCQDFSNLHKQIYQHNNFQKRVSVCEQWLLQNYTSLATNQFDHALALIYQSFGNIRVNNLSNLVGWSSRHLNRLFQLHTGLSTKAFAQTIRIQHACKQLYATQGHSLHTAYDLGYFDQSHLLKNWNKYLLSNPNAFFNRFKSDFYNN